MFTTSYKSEGMGELITALVKTVKANKIVELGTQQGHSAVLLAKGGRKVYTYDTFNETYDSYPFKKTHADIDKAFNNTVKHNIQIKQKDVFKVRPVNCDVLHIDICNHENNVFPLLEAWESKVKKMILLEGGILNKWQKKYGFKPFDPDVFYDWNYLIIKGKNGYAITVLTRK